MDLKNNNNTELSTTYINSETFEQIKNKIINAFEKIGISKDGMSIYYERHMNGSSILAIKLFPGEDSDMNNYMINGCLVEYYNNKPSCDIGFHANAKVGQNAMKIANMITQDIILFFETLEKEFLSKKLSNVELSVRIPLGDSKEKLPSQKQNDIKSKIRRLFKK